MSFTQGHTLVKQRLDVNQVGIFPPKRLFSTPCYAEAVVVFT